MMPDGVDVHDITISSQFHTHLSPFDRVDAACVLLFLASAVLLWRSFGPAYAVYTAVGVLLPLVHGLVSMERYVAVLFPAMALWAIVHNAAVQVMLFSVSLFFLVLAVTLYTTGYSVF